MCRILPILTVFTGIHLWSTPAAAYIDPGTGSFLLQGILAAILGAVVAIRMYWRRIRGLFGRRSSPDEDDGS